MNNHTKRFNKLPELFTRNEFYVILAISIMLASIIFAAIQNQKYIQNKAYNQIIESPEITLSHIQQYNKHNINIFTLYDEINKQEYIVVTRGSVRPSISIIQRYTQPE
jgi:hypothetical protein